MEFRIKITPVPLDANAICELGFDCGMPQSFKVEMQKLEETTVENERTVYLCTQHSAHVECIFDEMFE